MDAIVGLASSGKTAVFRALTAGHGSPNSASRAQHVGVVKQPDERLEKLASLTGARKVTHHEVALLDLPALFGPGGTLTPDSREAVAEAGALVQVVRAFHRDDVPHPLGEVDPDRDVKAFESELALNDLAVIERRLERIDVVLRSARPAERDSHEREVELLTRCRLYLEEGTPLRGLTDAGELKALSGFGLLSLKPALLVLNIDEGEAARSASLEADYRSRHQAPRTRVGAIAAKLESELAELPPEEASEFRSELGAGESPVAHILELLQSALDLVTFYTTVGDECRAWTVPAGTPVVQAAGRIHTDMQRGFIRAEVINCDRLLELGSVAEAKRHGELRTEGRQYPVQKGDVVHVLFHV
jgi:hypothetical protein